MVSRNVYSGWEQRAGGAQNTTFPTLRAKHHRQKCTVGVGKCPLQSGIGAQAYLPAGGLSEKHRPAEGTPQRNRWEGRCDRRKSDMARTRRDGGRPW